MIWYGCSGDRGKRGRIGSAAKADACEEIDSAFSRPRLKRAEAPLDERLRLLLLLLMCASGKVDRSPRNSLKSPLGAGRLSAMLNVAIRILRLGRTSSTSGGSATIGEGSATKVAGEAAGRNEEAVEPDLSLLLT